MLAVEDYIAALDWASHVGGLNGLIARATANAQAIWDFCETRDWIDNLAIDPATRSNTSVCLNLQMIAFKTGQNSPKRLPSGWKPKT